MTPIESLALPYQIATIAIGLAVAAALIALGFVAARDRRMEAYRRLRERARQRRFRANRRAVLRAAQKSAMSID